MVGEVRALAIRGLANSVPPNSRLCSAHIALKYVIAIEVGKRSDDK